AHGATFSANLLTRLADRGALMVFCGPNHAPHSLLWPLQGHHAQGGRMHDQITAPKPLRKQLWKQVVVAKIRMQQAILAAAGAPADAFDLLARKVRSGDPDNVEAQAARRYWPLLFGPEFRRDRTAGGLNVLLNYGYTVLRACVARAVIAAGLHPTLGIHHHNRANAFALADDLMEPFRPLVDFTTRQLSRENMEPELDAEAKLRLVRMLSFDLALPDSRTPVGGCVQRLAVSLA
ncbi:MAG TPA: type II CRISPR-associated endonuclease Cas1, partial [Thermopetrobacter sp.]|nr:type II CRISPR-associated endonuclease Cas1 [Thermopetrobacter sp.]